MAHAYTPGLKVTARTTVRRTRRLPLRGDVLVKEGDSVQASTVVARTDLPGKVFPVNVANQLAAPPEEVPELCLRKEGESIEAGQPLAISRGLLGMFKSTVQSPVSGTVESISKVTGQVLLREKPVLVEVEAYLDGKVVEVIPEEGVVVESEAALVQGIFGLGGEVHAPIRVVAGAAGDTLDADQITKDLKGCVALGGGLLTLAGARRAAEVGVAAVVTGGFHYYDVRELLGRDLGVAITGTENMGVTIVVTEGFGDIAMAQATFDLLSRHEGRAASVSGATQIRAGVIRPEVIVALEGAEATEAAERNDHGGLEIGAYVRAIRFPYFGQIGKVTSLPVGLQEMESGSKVRVVELEIEDELVVLPRANVERIEER